MQKNTLGLIGGGQLAMLIALIAKKYNILVECLEMNSNSSASKYSKILVGQYNDEKKIERLFKQNNFISYEFENINLLSLDKINKKYPNKCVQDIYPLFLTSNRIREKINLRNLGILTNKFSIIKSKEEIFYFLHLYKKNIIIKTAEFGYDGKGQIIIQNINDIENIKKAAQLISSTSCIVEEFVDFKQEISLTGVYYGNNNFKFLPLNENIHQKGILHKCKPLIDSKLQNSSEEIFKKLAIGINKKSIYTIEFFVTKNNELYVNEIAPRVHNSSHHGIDNYNFSQYDLFLSLFFKIKLPKLEIKSKKILINVLGQHYQKVKDELKFINNEQEVKFYDYYKNEPALNRKMGHLIISENTKWIKKFEEWCKI